MKRPSPFSKLVYAVVISLLIIIIVLGAANILKVKTIITNAEISDMEGLPVLGDKYIFNLPENELKKHFKKNPAIKTIVISPKFPSVVEINVVYRDKVAQINTNDGIFISDEDGFIFEQIATSSALPTISLQNKKLNLGINITQNNIITALQIVNLAKDKNFRVDNIVPNDDGTVVFTVNGSITVVIDLNSKAEDIVSSLQMILKRFTIEGKLISKIDFRFDKPVVTF